MGFKTLILLHVFLLLSVQFLRAETDQFLNHGSVSVPGLFQPEPDRDEANVADFNEGKLTPQAQTTANRNKRLMIAVGRRGGGGGGHGGGGHGGGGRGGGGSRGSNGQGDRPYQGGAVIPLYAAGAGSHHGNNHHHGSGTVNHVGAAWFVLAQIVCLVLVTYAY